jgi:predicted enzyme related to lactoylglutathione lyase
MATITQHAPGTFSWPELATTDQNAARTFYTGLFGWTAEDSPIGEGETYTMLKKGGQPIGALYTQQKEQRAQGVPPHWASYISVENADQSAAQAKQLGGQVILEPFDVMEHGRMAVIQDPTGAVFCLWQAKKHIGAAVLGEPGSMVWNELYTNDTGKAGTFYKKLFGWGEDKMPMPQGGEYTLFKRGDTQAGGMLAISPEMGPVPPNWMVYFGVDDADATVAKATSKGAKVLVPPTDIPNWGRFAILQDPQHAAFAIFASTKA